MWRVQFVAWDDEDGTQEVWEHAYSFRSLENACTYATDFCSCEDVKTRAFIRKVAA